MADFLPPHLQNLLPATMTPLQIALARSLVEHSCEAHFGVGPVVGNNQNASQNCHICQDSLSGNLNLRHAARDDQAEGDRSTRPCARSYHLLCLVDWAENNVNINRPVTCPGDRLELIPQESLDALAQQFNLNRPQQQHPIRDLDLVFQWWKVLDPDPAQRPDVAFDVQELDITTILQAASHGLDVGIAHSEVLSRLPLDYDVWRTFWRYECQQQVVDGPLDQNGNYPVGAVYPIYIYINTIRELAEDHQTGDERAEYILVPITRRMWTSLRRYLFGMMGPVVAVSWPPHASMRITLLNMRTAELVDIHAEHEIRSLMQVERAGVQPAATHIWYWPWPTNGGGIVVGGQLVDTEYPARGLTFDGLNVTQYSEAAYASVLDRLDPFQRQFTQDRITDYMNGRLPETFPRPGDTIGREVFHIPHYRHLMPPGSMFNGPAPQQRPDAITRLPGTENQSTYENYYNHFLRQQDLRRRNQRGPWVPWNPPYRSPARPLPQNADGTYDMTDFDHLIDLV